MDFHLERQVRLHTQPEYKNLHNWAINEIDADGKKIDRDRIPWRWTLYFTATSCELRDNIKVESPYPKEGTTPEPSKVEQHRFIRVQLRPGGPRDQGNYHRQTMYSMFGTARAIEHFELNIQSANADEAEGCTAWGCPSYTTDIDFRNETSDDCVVFTLTVQPETFARYVSQVEQGLVDEMIFSAGWVDGFYTDWSPSISTRDIKVLTANKEHQVTLPADDQFEPPRLGYVGECALYINRRLEFGKQPQSEPEAEVIEDRTDIRRETVTPTPQAVVDPQTLQMLRSLRRAAWLIAWILALILIVMLLRR